MKHILAIFLGFFVLPAFSISMEKKMEAFDYIAKFSNAMCFKAPIDGRSTSVQLTIEAKAELNNLLKYLLNIGVGASAQISSQEYSGIMQKDLLSALKYNDTCRKNYFESLVKLFKLDNPVVSSEINFERGEDTFKIKREDGSQCETKISSNGSFVQKCN